MGIRSDYAARSARSVPVPTVLRRYPGLEHPPTVAVLRLLAGSELPLGRMAIQAQIPGLGVGTCSRSVGALHFAGLIEREITPRQGVAWRITPLGRSTLAELDAATSRP